MLYLSGRKRRKFFRLSVADGRIKLTSVKEMEIEEVDWIYLTKGESSLASSFCTS